MKTIMLQFSEFQFGESAYVLLALLILALGVLYQYRKKSEYKNLSQIKPRIIDNTVHKENPYFRLPSISAIIVASLLLLISTLRPQYGYELIEGVQEGVDLIIAADVSDSMLVEDVKPDRLQFQRRKITDLLRMVQGDRISLISFAGASFIETPLTLDYGSVSSIIETISTDLVPLKGSNFDSIAGSAVHLFDRQNSQLTHSARSRALIIFSDGEFEEGTVELGLESLKKHHINPYLIIIGSEEGGLIPSGNGFKKNQNGTAIVSKADESYLKQVFANSNGTVIRATLNDADLKEVYLDGIKNKLKQDKIKYNNVRKWYEYYQIPLVAALIIIVGAWGAPLTKNARLSMVNLFLIAGMYITPASAQPIDASMRKGYELYELGKFSEALEHFSAAPNETFEKHIATGNSYYRMGDFVKAEQEFGKAQSLAQTPQERSKALFNGANSAAQLGNYEKALEGFQKAKKENPKDAESEANIQYVKKLIQEKEKEDSQHDKSHNDNSSENQPQDSQDNSKSSDSSQSQNNLNSSSPKGEEKGNSRDESNEDYTRSNQPHDKDSNNDDDPNKKPQETEEKNEPNDFSTKDEPAEQVKATPRRPDSSTSNNKHTQTNENDLKNNADQMTKDQLESQLESLDENTDSRNQYRYKKALEQLERENRNFPTMDW